MPNAPVSINAPTLTTVPLDTAKTILGLSVSDVDIGGIYTVSLMPSHGTLSLGSDSGITYYPEPIIGTVDMSNLGGEIFSAPPPGSLFIGGSLADINAALATLIFTPQGGYTGPGGFVFMVSDHAGAGDDRTSDYEEIALNIGGNQAPAIANLSGDTAAYVEESLPISVDVAGNALVTDDQANFDGGSLTITLLNRDTDEDIIVFDTNVVQAGENDNGLNDVYVDGVVIGEMALEYGTQVDDIAITFNSNATAARVTMLLNALTYYNLDPVDPTEGTRTVEYVLTDGSGPEAQTTTVQSFISVTDTLEINREALLDLDSTQPGTDVTRSYTEGAAAIQLAPSATTDDPDLLPYNGGSLTIAVDSANAGDQLTIVNGGGVVLEVGGTISVHGSIVVASYSGGTNGTPLVLNFLPVGSVATTPEHIVDELVRAIRYRTTSDAPEATRTITFTLNDGGGTEHGGDDTAVRTATVNVTAINDAPSGTTSDGPDLAENGSRQLTLADFGFSDVDGNAFEAVLFTGVTGGQIAVDVDGNGVPNDSEWVTPPVIVTAAQIADGRLWFAPTPGLTGEDVATISFRVRDDGGTANGGVEMDPTANTITFDVLAVNEQPSGGDETVVLVEDGAHQFSASDFNFGDTDGNALLEVVITTLPTAGTLYLGGSAIPAPGTVVSAADIAAGLLTYRPAADGNGAGYASFTFQVRDDGGTAVGGQDTDQTPDIVTIDVTAVNDAPVNTVIGPVGTNEDTAVVLSTTGTAISVADIDAAGPISYSLSVDHGTLTIRTDVVGGITAGDIQAITDTGNGTATITIIATASQINTTLAANSALIYTPAANYNGSDTLYVYANDGGQTGSDPNPVSILDPISGTPVGPITEEDYDTVAIAIAAVEDAPSGADGLVTLVEDGSYTFTAADFGFNDIDGDSLLEVGIMNLPADGALYLNDVAITVPLVAISVAAIADGALTYRPAANGNGLGYASFTFQVRDDGGTANGGEDTDPFPNTMMIDVTPANDAPTITLGDDTVSGTEDVALVFSAANGNAITVDDIDGGTLTVTLSVAVLWPGARLTLAQTTGLTVIGNNTVLISMSGSAADINAALEGLVYYGGLNVQGSELLQITVNDGQSPSVSGAVALTLADDGVINGNGGNNTLTGTWAGDYFDLSQGGDEAVTGLGGNDAFYFGDAFTGADTVDGGAGDNDQIGLEGDYTGANALTLTASSITEVEVIAMLPGFDYSLTTVDANVPAGGKLRLFAGNLGAGDNFTFNGAAETDGSFMVYGGMGTDLVTTGAGDDGIYFGPGKFDPTVDRVDGGTGANDQLALDGDYVLTLSGTAIQNIDVIALLKGEPGDLSDYNLTLADSLVEAGETMTVWGAKVETAMIVDGNAESDGSFRMFGGTKSDTLIGGAGDDWFWGGLGADGLVGGDGSDTFHYESVDQSRAGSIDTLIEFDDAVDKIDLGVAVTGFAGPLWGALDMVTIGTQLEAAAGSLGIGQALVFTVNAGTLNGNTFLLVDGNGTAGYQAAGDFLFLLSSPVSPIDNPGMFI